MDSGSLKVWLLAASQKVTVPVIGFEEVTVAVVEIGTPSEALLLAKGTTMLVGTAGTCVTPPPPTLVVVEPPPQPSAATITEHAPRAAGTR